MNDDRLNEIIPVIPAKGRLSRRAVKTRRSRKRNTLSVENLVSCQYSAAKLPKRRTPNPLVRLGLSFEKKWHTFASSSIHTKPGTYRSSVTINYRHYMPKKGLTRPKGRLCELDGLYLSPHINADHLNPPCIIYECKLTNTYMAWRQLRHLYYPVIRKLHAHRPIALVQVCRNYSPLNTLPPSPPPSGNHPVHPPQREVVCRSYSDIVFSPDILNTIIYDPNLPPPTFKESDLKSPPPEYRQPPYPATTAGETLKELAAVGERLSKIKPASKRDPHRKPDDIKADAARVQNLWWHPNSNYRKRHPFGKLLHPHNGKPVALKNDR